MILILSSKFDQSTNSVIDWLNYMGEDVIRMNKDDDRFLFNSLTRDGVYFTDRHSNQIINLLDAKACWWRRTGLSFSTFSRSQSSVKSKENIDISYDIYLKDEKKYEVFFNEIKDYSLYNYITFINNTKEKQKNNLIEEYLYNFFISFISLSR